MNGKIDKRFAVPPYLSDQENENDYDYGFSTEGTQSEPDLIGPDVEPSIDWVYPNTFTVIEQTVRTVNGTQVVDIIIEVEDQPEIKEYEVRVAKP